MMGEEGELVGQNLMATFRNCCHRYLPFPGIFSLRREKVKKEEKIATNFLDRSATKVVKTDKWPPI